MTDASRASTSRASSRELAVRSFRLIETGDPELAQAIVAPDFVNLEADDDPDEPDRQQHGPDGFLATGRWLRAAFADLRFHEREVAVDGPVVLAASTMTGRHTGTFQSVPATGRTINQEQVHIFRIADGRITSHRAVRDDLGLLLQLGWQPGSGG